MKDQKKKFQEYLDKWKEIGYVDRVIQATIEIVGLPSLRSGEAVVFETGEIGIAMSIKREEAEVLVLSRNVIKQGTRVARTGFDFSLGASEEMRGKTINPLGMVVKGEVMSQNDIVWMSTDTIPAGISARRRINRQLETGMAIMDLMVPIGMGQRELIAGDRKTGKSTLLMQTILAQAKKGVICIYAVIGKKKTDILKVEDFFEKEKITDNTVLVATTSQDSAGEIYLCPYAAMTLAEYFRNKGKDVLVVMDDITTHAHFYRELSLLLRRFPGRDSYPGDIFHTHSKLLERAGNFMIKTEKEEKEVSITCLPVVETVQGDITGYIQTNLMSMTDGHVYIDNELYYKGRRPAVNVFVSVTRVGHQTQSPLRRNCRQMVMDLMNNYEKTQDFLKFGAELGENSRQILAMGEKVLSFFNQPIYCVIPLNMQLVALALLMAGLWNGLGIEKIVEAYVTDKEYEKEVTGLVDGSQTMDSLLTAVRAKADLLLKVTK